MYRYIGKKKKRARRIKILLVSAAACAAIIIGTGTSVAWLGAQSDPISNEFSTAEVTCRISETFSDGLKSDVRIQNTGNMDAYIRTALTPVWKDGDNIAGMPASLSDCSITWNDSFGTIWVCGCDGYYYCKQPIGPGDYTPVLIDECTVSTSGDYRFELQISAQAVQALPVYVVTDIWDSAVTTVNTDGTLEVAQ